MRQIADFMVVKIFELIKYTFQLRFDTDKNKKKTLIRVAYRISIRKRMSSTLSNKLQNVSPSYLLNCNTKAFVYCDNTPIGRPPLSQPSKPLLAIRLYSGFSHLRPGVFHISLQTHKKQHTQLRGWKKREQTITGLG